MRWEQGRATIEKMLGDNELQRVPPSREQADFLVDQALRHIASAKAISDVAPPGAYQLAYDAARSTISSTFGRSSSTSFWSTAG